jgi:hypothetical protein
MRTIVEEARRLDMAVPPAVVLTVDLWSGWNTALDSRREEG